MADSWLDAKEQVRQAVDIVELMGRDIQLRREGRGFAGLCPWHDDSRPSLKVNPDRQTFKCWVCDIGGDVFSYVMQRDGVEFREAMTMLAELAGVQIRQTPSGGSGGADEKRKLYEAMAWAEREYHRYLLEAAEAEPGRKYLAARGISDESIRRFHLGFAPNRWDWLLSRLPGTPYSTKILEKLGLVVPRNSDEGYYDRFRGRVLFSIRDVQSRPIALGGRILPEFAEKDPAKYINSPESPLFSKSHQLYGLDVAREAISRSGSVSIVEGYTDCIMAQQHGVGNVLAVLGTALGEGHIRLLKRYAETITLVLDGDEAGQRRTNEILELFVAQQVNLRILTLPRDLDPCDFVVEHGGEAFGRLLAEAVDALEHKIRTVTNGLDIAVDTHRANAALEDVLGTLARAPRLSTASSSATRLREHQVLARLARDFRLDEAELRVRLASLRRKRQPTAQAAGAASPAANDAPTQQVIGRLDPWDEALLELVIVHPERLAEVAGEIEPDDLRTPVARVIYNRCLAIQAEGGTADFDRLMLESEDARMKNLLVKLEEAGRAKSGPAVEQALCDVLDRFRQRKEDARHRETIAQMREGKSPQSEEDAIGNLLADLRTRHRRPETGA